MNRESARYLKPHERKDIVLVLIEAMKNSSIFNKEATGNMLDVIIQDPDFWLADLMASSELQSQDVADESQLESNERHPNLVTVSLFLGVLVTLSERPDTARTMKALLPHIMKMLHGGYTNMKMKVLVVVRNVMGHLNRTEASQIAVQLVEDLLPLFDHESSQLRELSISLCRILLQSVVENEEWKMKIKVRGFLVPLIFHMSDQVDSVAQASREALLAAAELLGWKKLKARVQTGQTQRIGECLLARDRSRADKYVCQSLRYLEAAQPSLREEAMRFIGLAERYLRSEQHMSWLCRALKNLERDSESSICSLAAQTLHRLGSPWQRQWRTLGRNLQVLCCCCC
ncbi:uncharacterized protein LOC142365418 [Opisthocomus hoazin]|uniref:uncharacterized protein LOC142365418 n=1 Tax=Opisthocomus hoazin TaxID=30419 RepID=UPI003F537C05